MGLWGPAEPLWGWMIALGAFHPIENPRPHKDDMYPVHIKGIETLWGEVVLRLLDPSLLKDLFRLRESLDEANASYLN